MCRPRGLRFSADGSAVCVAASDHVSLFRVADGAFVWHIATGVRNPYDVEEVEGGWAVACCGSHAVEFVGADGRSLLGKAGGMYGDGNGEFCHPAALALVPGLGLVVREYGNGRRLQVLPTPDMVNMRRMAPIRVAWMGAVARAILRRSVRVIADQGCGMAK